MESIGLIAVLALLWSSLALAGQPTQTVDAGSPDPVAQAAQAITSEEIRRHVAYLASDRLEGRAPATEGDRLAEEYIAGQFQELGLVPAAPDGGWYQPFDIVGVDGHPEQLMFSAVVDAGVNTPHPLALRYGKDFIAVAGGQKDHSTLAGAEVVFVGYGIVAPEYQWDDFKGVDLKGKVLLVMNNDPQDDPNLFAGKTRLYYGRWDYKYEQAARVGAAGAIIIHTTPSAGYPWQVVQTSWAGEQFSLPASGEPRLEVRAWTTEAATRRICRLAGKDLDRLRNAAESRDFRPVPLGIQVSTDFPNQVSRKRTANVLGEIKGSDPALAGQMVFYTAHHDHLGKKEGVKPGQDSIYNGAVDNASGVGEMLAVAKAFTRLPHPPKRSILFAAVAAEEQDLLGSRYLSAHPPVPAGDVAADINMDGANIWGRTTDFQVIGLGKSSLDQLIQAIAKAQGRHVTCDQFPDRGFYYRSDQLSFARIGVPSADGESGNEFIGRPKGWGKKQREKWEATHYHQPSDELDPSWDLSGAVEDTRLYFELGLRVAEADGLPTWTSGDEFEGARKKALDEARRAR